MKQLAVEIVELEQQRLALVAAQPELVDVLASIDRLSAALEALDTSDWVSARQEIRLTLILEELKALHARTCSIAERLRLACSV